jgi:ribonuclease P protein component
LLRADGFDHVIRAKNIADRHFKIFFTPNGQNNARLGIITSKKTLPGAAQRNRIKRVIRETFRQNTIKFCKLDLVVMMRDPYQKVDTHIDYLERLFSQVENRCAE